MMIIRYKGLYKGETTGIGVTKPGDVVEVPKEFAMILIRQANWEEVKPRMKKITKKDKKKKVDDNVGDDIK